MCTFIAFLSKRLTVEGQVSEEGSQQVHDEHGQEGHVGDTLHLSAGAAVWGGRRGDVSFRHRSTVFFLFM